MTATADPQAIIADLAGRSKEEIARVLTALTLAEQEAVLALLAAVPDVVIQGNARRLWQSKSREYIMAGPAECAKTFTLCQYFHEQCMNFPRLRAVLLRDTYEALRTSAIRTYKEKIIRMDERERSPYGVKVFGGERPEFFQYPNGSRLYVKGLDNPGNVLSEEWDLAGVCQAEMSPGDTWGKLKTRTTGRAGNLPRSYRGPRLIGECNPGPPNHWILGRRDAGYAEFVEHEHSDNPSLYDPEGRAEWEYDEGSDAWTHCPGRGHWTDQGHDTLIDLQTLEGVDYERLYKGRWVAAEGTIFTLTEANLGSDLYVPNWPTQLAIDPSNGSGPYVALVIQQHNDRILVVDEFYQVGGMDEDFVAWAKASRYYARLTDAISDPAKADTIKRLSSMLKKPVRAKEGKKDITAQINAVKSVLVPDQATKKSKLLIDRDACPMLLNEFSLYKYRKPRKDEPTDMAKRTRHAIPEDDNDHLINALEYWITTKHLTGQQQSLLAAPTVDVQRTFSFGHPR